VCGLCNHAASLAVLVSACAGYPGSLTGTLLQHCFTPLSVPPTPPAGCRAINSTASFLVMRMLLGIAEVCDTCWAACGAAAMGQTEMVSFPAVR
jgi:hypothetical protein